MFIIYNFENPCILHGHVFVMSVTAFNQLLQEKRLLNSKEMCQNVVFIVASTIHGYAFARCLEVYKYCTKDY